jgi:hypothetical protein
VETSSLVWTTFSQHEVPLVLVGLHDIGSALRPGQHLSSQAATAVSPTTGIVDYKTGAAQSIRETLGILGHGTAGPTLLIFLFL